MRLEKKEDLIKEIKKNVSDHIDLQKDISDEELKERITEFVFEKSRQTYLSISEKKGIVERIFNAMRGLDILQPILEDQTITEVMVNGPNDIFIERNGKTFRLDTCFESKEKLEDVIQSIVSKVNRTVNEASPIVDARLQDGSRINVVLSPIALNGPILTIRKFPEKAVTAEQLIQYGSLTGETDQLLQCMVRAKYNIFVCGGTSSGMTIYD